MTTNQILMELITNYSSTLIIIFILVISKSLVHELSHAAMGLFLKKENKALIHLRFFVTICIFHSKHLEIWLKRGMKCSGRTYFKDNYQSYDDMEIRWIAHSGKIGFLIWGGLLFLFHLPETIEYDYITAILLNALILNLILIFSSERNEKDLESDKSIAEKPNVFKDFLKYGILPNMDFRNQLHK